MKKDDRERFTLRIPAALFNNIKESSSKQGISINALILQILWDWLEKENK